METEFKVKAGEFEGPLDLLLSLVEKRKLFINDISLADVTDSFIEYIKQFENFPISNSAEFIITASTLMLIKSVSLLPGIKLTQEESESIENLEERLKLYKDIKEKSEYIKKLFGSEPIFLGGYKGKKEIFFSPTTEVTIQNLLDSAKNVINSIPKKERIPQAIIKKVMSLEEAIDTLSKRVQTSLKMKWSEFARIKGGSSPEEIKAEKINIVVNFLAMLELVKRGLLLASQQSNFSEIDMETGEARVPKYGV